MEYDRKGELKAFDESKTGVKGLIESGVTRIPRIFIHDQKKLNEYSLASEESNYSIPIIDLEDVNKCRNRHKEVTERVGDASQKWGFFQVVNHGIRSSVLEEMIDGVRRFHELDPEVRKKFYTRDESRKVMYNTNFDFYQAPAANWRDSLFCAKAPSPPSSQELPHVCRFFFFVHKFCILNTTNLGYN